MRLGRTRQLLCRGFFPPSFKRGPWGGWGRGGMTLLLRIFTNQARAAMLALISKTTMRKGRRHTNPASDHPLDLQDAVDQPLHLTLDQKRADGGLQQSHGPAGARGAGGPGTTGGRYARETRRSAPPLCHEHVSTCHRPAVSPIAALHGSSEGATSKLAWSSPSNRSSKRRRGALIWQTYSAASIPLPKHPRSLVERRNCREVSGRSPSMGCV